MNDNLPEINFKEKKEKKKGFIGWLRGKMGVGSRGAVGEAGINPSVMNVGRGLGMGGAKFGSSAGLAGLLAGKASVIATVALMAVGTGVYLANKAPAPSTSANAFNSSGKVQDNYVPAILRSQAANQGSSLDMFKETNKGAGLAMEADPSKAPGKPAEETPAPADEAKNAEQPAPDGNMAQEMMGKLQGGSIGSLSSSMGGGSNKFSSMGGFGNKFNQGATGAKTGFTSGIGAGFQGMPKFDARKSKMSAMKPSSRPVLSASSAGKKGKFGTGAFGQAKGMKTVQQSYGGREVDKMAGTQNKAWEGATPEGTTTGGTGVSDGGAGIMSSPSLDGASAGGGGGDMGVPEEPVIPEASAPIDVSPWAGLPQKAMMLIMLSCLLATIGAYIISLAKATAVFVGLGGWLYSIGMIICGLAALVAVMAILVGVQLMSSFGQSAMGGVYVLGGGLAAAGAILAMTGTPGSSMGTTAAMLLAGAAIASLFGSMLGGK
ncbi:MAG: hypothetical protein A2X35_01285 [Elusimicrobia bacterium GWA2_61_42]|nr:MAG: hypothetical protein A2X35_01285 [Elusimicrobia bacterium GWA2_61_42]OGR76301.1 MAG: hypothetical protein A2X38_05150 [Elusimicrobia bacterium GWC2_61_25]